MQVGLNVAADPLMSLAYVGVKGGMVIVVRRRPGADFQPDRARTRGTLPAFSKLPVFRPSSPEEAYEMVKDAFDLSEKYETRCSSGRPPGLPRAASPWMLGNPLPRRPWKAL
jgi:indolepyruvate ferredoxin oxidoreductase alpha subunit